MQGHIIYALQEYRTYSTQQKYRMPRLQRYIEFHTPWDSTLCGIAHCCRIAHLVGNTLACRKQTNFTLTFTGTQSHISMDVVSPAVTGAAGDDDTIRLL